MADAHVDARTLAAIAARAADEKQARDIGASAHKHHAKQREEHRRHDQLLG